MAPLSTLVKPKDTWTKISDVNLDLYYSEKFIPKKLADELFEKFEEEFEYLSDDVSRVKVFGKWHNIPRQQVAYGDEGLSYKFSGSEVPAQPWPSSLKELKTLLTEMTGHEYNFVLINRYRNGDDCIGEHKDDESDLDPLAPVVSLSFGQTRDFILKYASKTSDMKTRVPVKKIPLSHGDLLCMNAPTNKYWTHSVPRRKNITDVRISLTFRRIVSTEMSKSKKASKRTVTSPYFDNPPKKLC